MCVRARVCVCAFLRELSTCWWTRFDCACVAWCLTVAVAHQNTHGQLGHGITPSGDFGSHQLPKRVQGLEKKIVINAAAGGHFSVVHRAVRKSDERRVALKKVQIFDMLDAKARDRCLKEVQLHPVSVWVPLNRHKSGQTSRGFGDCS